MAPGSEVTLGSIAPGVMLKIVMKEAVCIQEFDIDVKGYKCIQNDILQKVEAEKKM